MITFFATPKPFRGHIGVIQRNAIRSWQALHPDAEILLLGPEEGTAETAHEFGLRHEALIPCNDFGTVLLSGLFDRAQELARHATLCFINCDIILTGDFLCAVQRVMEWRPESLMVGRRWDLNIAEPLNFAVENWDTNLRATALRQGFQRPPQWIDYFVFPRGFFLRKIPDFAVGRSRISRWAGLVTTTGLSGARAA
jgi:hypothetical protein